MTSVIQYYGTGRRKTATARVRLIPGTGNLTINGRTLEDFFGNRPQLVREIQSPFELAEAGGRFDVMVTVCGGGVTGQAGAIRHGIARALAEAAPQNRPLLRTGTMLTRDPRVKERKKYGRKKARKRFQFSKR
jgi:small subunit ribosomal protein S9